MDRPFYNEQNAAHLVCFHCPRLDSGGSPRERLSDAADGFRVVRDVPYVTNNQPRQVLDLYLPQSEKPLPLIIWVHGGGWKQGSKNQPLGIGLTRDGYALASINYRLSQNAIFPAQIQDCKAAVRWLRAHAKEYNLDPDRFGAWGASAGGHLVALLGVTGDIKDFDVGENLDQSSKVQAVADYFGPTRLFLPEAWERAADKIPRDLSDSPVAALLGGPIAEKGKLARSASPVTYVTKGDAPMLIVHGDKDPLVPLWQSEIMERDMKAAGVPCELVVVKGAGHGNGFTQAETRKVKDFFDKQLKNTNAGR